jgi:hypothetical protein
MQDFLLIRPKIESKHEQNRFNKSIPKKQVILIVIGEQKKNQSQKIDDQNFET